MKILFFSHYFPPEVNAPANRTHEHCREWVKAGHEVHVITCVPSHPLGMPFKGYRMKWYQRETIDGIEIHRVRTYLAANCGVMNRTLNYLSFITPAVWRATRLGTFDIIIGTSPQFFCAVAAAVAAWAKRTPWVFEVRDLWPDSIRAVGAARRYMPLRLLERLELRLYRAARTVVCASQSFVENLESRGIDPQKLHFVPNGVDPTVWISGSRADGRAALGVAAEDILVSYIGTVGMAHDIGTTLDAAAVLQTTRPDIRFAIVGDGAELPALQRRAEALALTNVVFTGLVPRDRIPHYLAATDVSLITLRRSDTFKMVLPSKMFEAMAAAKPIVLAVEGEAKRTLERAGAGRAVAPGDSLALCAAILAFADDAELRRRMGAAGTGFVAREFSRAAWAHQYLDTLEHSRAETPVASSKPPQAAEPVAVSAGDA
jgi:glycosyltransferase involved in cell wall biosynthesis